MIYKVLIVDDEYYIRQHLKFCIDWEEEGFEIVAEASNGDEASHILNENKIDLAIVDISMPQKDGLSMIKELREQNIEVKIIILSGYGTFNYAKKAIKYGIEDYLLKPLDEDELRKTLKKVRQVLDSEKQNRQLSQIQYHTAYQLNTVNKDIFFKKIFVNHALLPTDIYDMETKLNSYGLKVDTPSQIIVFDLKSKYLQSLSLEEGDLQLFRYAAANILEELSVEYFYHTVTACDIFSHGILIIESETNQTLSESLSLFLENAHNKVRELLKIEICFGCSTIFPLSLKNLNLEYKHALIAYTTSNLQKNIYTLFQVEEKITTISFPILQTLEKIEAAFSAHNQVSLFASIDTLFSFIEAETISFYNIDQILSKLVMICYDHAADSTLTQPESNDLSFLFGYKELLFTGYDLIYIKQKVIQLFSTILSAPSSVNNSKELLVQEALHFINAHYARYDMSLSLISKNLLVSASYLSSIFKKETGISITQYITKYRMEKAKEYLMNDQLTLKEIAEQLGYNDSFYFSKVFKKYFGVSPSSYRN